LTGFLSRAYHEAVTTHQNAYGRKENGMKKYLRRFAKRKTRYLLHRLLGF
jgi:hypothetical protein